MKCVALEALHTLHEECNVSIKRDRNKAYATCANVSTVSSGAQIDAERRADAEGGSGCLAHESYMDSI
jgi:hypothetical protein